MLTNNKMLYEETLSHWTDSSKPRCLGQRKNTHFQDDDDDDDDDGAGCECDLTFASRSGAYAPTLRQGFCESKLQGRDETIHMVANAGITFSTDVPVSERTISSS